MAAARAVQARTAAPTLFSIGQVLAKLTPEFPDLSPSKLRFLEAERLVAPARTESGYRKFSHADIERLRFVLTMQRDHYLPLKVIRVQLEDFDAGRVEKLAPPARLPGSILDSERRLTRADLLREAGATAPLLADAVSHSLLPAADAYGEDAVLLLRSLVELQRFGLEPRHLRGFRQAAEREVGLIDSAVEPIRRRPGAESRARAAELGREIAARLEVIRTALVRSALERLDRQLR
ncbi:MAG: MerR family transcriptional regulator [Micrococcales bacterium 73-13]|nr:MAG: MerR family transcriptional regulator [Micrococcales bacterium 73-13]